MAAICREAEGTAQGLKTHLTDLVGSHPGLIDVLTERLERGLASEPVSWKAMMDSE